MLNIAEGTKVEASYYGTEFVGLVTIARAHTINWNVTVVHITPEAPITVLGTEREAVSMWVDRNGIGTDGAEADGNWVRTI